jgi:cytochrome c5
MNKLLVFTICILLLTPTLGFSMTGEEVYQKSCAMCHNSGVAGAPKLGDKDAWSPRIAEGTDSLYSVAIKGKGAMPAKGGNAALSDDEVKAAVDYMIEESK